VGGFTRSIFKVIAVQRCKSAPSVKTRIPLYVAKFRRPNYRQFLICQQEGGRPVGTKGLALLCGMQSGVSHLPCRNQQDIVTAEVIVLGCYPVTYTFARHHNSPHISGSHKRTL